MEKLILLNWTPSAEKLNTAEQITYLNELLKSDKFDVSIETYERSVIRMLEKALNDGLLDSLSVYIKATDTCYDYDPDDEDNAEHWQQMYTEL